MKNPILTEPPEFALVAANDDWRIHRSFDPDGQYDLFRTWVDPDEIWGEAMNRASRRAVEELRRRGVPLPIPPTPIPPGKYPSLRQACQRAIDNLAREHPDWAPMRIIDYGNLPVLTEKRHGPTQME